MQSYGSLDNTDIDGRETRDLSTGGTRLNRGSWLILASLFVLAAALRAFLAVRLPLDVGGVDYDGWWHVFVAAQPDWGAFRHEYLGTAHPPLFFVLLKGVMAFGRTVFCYRLVSLLAGLGTMAACAAVAVRMGLERRAVLLAAVVGGFSPILLGLSLEVRSYALCGFLLLVSLLFYLDWLKGRESWRCRAGFAGFFVLAALSHHMASLYLGACLLAPVYLAAGNPALRRRFSSRSGRAWWADFAVVVVCGWTSALLLSNSGQRFIRPLNHLPLYYFDWGGSESVAAFLWRNSVNLLRLYVGPVWVAVPVLACLVLSAWCLHWRRESQDPVRGVASAFLAILAVEMAVCGVLGVYPFGGAERHQYPLLVFLLLSGVVAVDDLARRIGNPKVASTIWILVFAGLAHWPVAAIQHGFAPSSRSEWTSRTPALESPAVWVDSYSTMFFFRAHHDWDWIAGEKDLSVPGVKTLRMRSGPRTVVVLRDVSEWNSGLREEGSYARLSRCLRELGLRCSEVYNVGQTCLGQAASGDSIRLPDAETVNAARRAGLELQRGERVGCEVSAEFCAAASQASGPRPEITRLAPAGTRPRQSFQTQPGGEAAIAVLGRNFVRGAVIRANGHALQTVFADSGYLTAIFPSALYAKIGTVRVDVLGPDGQESLPVYFAVRE